MIKRPHVNKRGRLGEEQKRIIRKQKGEGFSTLLIPLAKSALSFFDSRKKKENMARRNRIIMVK